MTAITGGKTVLGITINSVIDSAIAAGAGHKVLCKSIIHGRNSSELSSNPIGGGLFMQQESDVGSVMPSFTVGKDMKYDDQAIALIAQMFGSENVTAWGGANLLSVHSLLFNENLNTNYANIAFHGSSATVYEYINAAIRRVQLNFRPNQYLDATFDGIATDRKITATTNTPATLVAATEPANAKMVVVRPAHYVRINAQAGGALANSDAVAITEGSVEFTRDQELVEEIRGASGNGAPRATGLFAATLSVTFKNQNDFTWITAYEAGTEYKADVVISDTATTKEFNVCFPRLKIVAEPKYDITDDGENQATVVFKALYAATAPTGMITGNGYPYVRVVNSSGKYLKT